MLREKQILEIREHLERAQNPVFYFDNDADGLCSYLLLRRFIGRGRGVVIRSFPDLNGQYARKARELNADYVFVLDKPLLSKEFVDAIYNMGLPLIHIDHHDVRDNNYGNMVFEYNPAKNKDKSEEPVTYLCYKIVNRLEEIWLAIIGCIADHYLPDFSSKFGKRFPDFWGKGIKEPFDAYYGTEIGKIAQAFNFGLKDSITNVVRMQNHLLKCKNPSDVLMEGSGNHSFRKKYGLVKKKYDILVEKAKRGLEENLLFFEYGGDLSISADLSNELSYRYGGKYIVVVYLNGAVANLSIRGRNVRTILSKVLEKVEGSGGGHNNAVGGRIKKKDLEKFKILFKKEIEE